MKRHFLPATVAVAMTKSQFCFCTGCTPYKLRQILATTPEKWKRLGYQRYDKLLMPATIRELLAVTGLRVDMDYYIQYVQGQRGKFVAAIEEIDQ
jgi:hypothetical protein